MKAAVANKIKVFVVDDHMIVINGIVSALDGQIDIDFVGYALNADEAQTWLSQHEADVILLDIHIPGIDGMELCKILKKNYPQLRIVGLTSFTQVSFISEMLRNGADGYMFKSTSEHELIEAIRTVFRGEQYLSNEVSKRIVSKTISKSAGESNFIPKLTRRELQVLELISEEYTNQEIAKKLFLSVSTVETHRMNLSSKLDARNTAGMVKKAIKFGLI